MRFMMGLKDIPRSEKVHFVHEIRFVRLNFRSNMSQVKRAHKVRPEAKPLIAVLVPGAIQVTGMHPSRCTHH